jgi:hypothetical protein
VGVGGWRRAPRAGWRGDLKGSAAGGSGESLCARTRAASEEICTAARTVSRTVCERTETVSETICDATQTITETICDASQTITETICDSFGQIPFVGELFCQASHTVSTVVCTASHVVSTVVCTASHVVSTVVCTVSKIVRTTVCVATAIATTGICIAEWLVGPLLLRPTAPEVRFVVQTSDPEPVSRVAALVHRHLGPGWEVLKLFPDLDARRDLPQLDTFYLVRKATILIENPFDVGYRLRDAAGFRRVDPDLSFTHVGGAT